MTQGLKAQGESEMFQAFTSFTPGHALTVIFAKLIIWQLQPSNHNLAQLKSVFLNHSDQHLRHS